MKGVANDVGRERKRVLFSNNDDLAEMRGSLMAAELCAAALSRVAGPALLAQLELIVVVEIHRMAGEIGPARPLVAFEDHGSRPSASKHSARSSAKTGFCQRSRRKFTTYEFSS